jgi:hypothetical protein
MDRMLLLLFPLRNPAVHGCLAGRECRRAECLMRSRPAPAHCMRQVNMTARIQVVEEASTNSYALLMMMLQCQRRHEDDHAQT